jgi:hypothetical protein
MPERLWELAPSAETAVSQLSLPQKPWIIVTVSTTCQSSRGISDNVPVRADTGAPCRLRRPIKKLTDA